MYFMDMKWHRTTEGVLSAKFWELYYFYNLWSDQVDSCVEKVEAHPDHTAGSISPRLYETLRRCSEIDKKVKISSSVTSTLMINVWSPVF